MSNASPSIRQDLLSFDAAQGTFSMPRPTSTALCWQAMLEANGTMLPAETGEITVLAFSPLRVRIAYPTLGLTWTLQAEELPEEGTMLLSSTLENSSMQPIALGKVTPCSITALNVTSGAVILCCPHGQHNRIVYRLADAEATRWSKVKIQLFDANRTEAIQIGFQTFLRANTEVVYEYAESELRDLRAYADFAGWQLQPGDTTPVETFVLAIGDNPHRQLQQWADRASATIHPRCWQQAALGWLGWTWVDAFNSENYEETMLRNCEAINRRLPGFGFEYVWLSIGNLPGGHPGAWTGWNERSFPHGMEYLVRRLESMGFKLGLWCGPFWISSHLDDLMAEMGEALQRRPDGTLLVSRPRWDYGDCVNLPAEQRPKLYALDPTHPKALAFLENAFAVNRARGVRYYMIDFLYAGAGNINGPGSPEVWEHAPLFDASIVPGPEAFHQALQVIRQAAGTDAYLLGSTGPTLHVAGIVDAVRTGNDFGEGRAIARDSYFYPATNVINSASFWTGCLPALRNQAAAYYTHRKLYLNDAGNVLTVDKPLPLSDARVHATIHALCGGPSMLGDDIDRIDEERLSLIKKTLPRAEQVAFPIDLFDAPAPDYPKLFHRRIEKPWGAYDVLAVYNFSPDTLCQSVELPRLGLDATVDYLVWEFWDECYLGRVHGALEVDVPPGSVKVFRLTADRQRPQLLATDMHVLMGEVEVLDCRWDAARGILSGRAIRPAGERGNLFLHAPESMRVAEPRGLWIAKDGRDNTLIIRCALDFAGGDAEWQIGFMER